MTKYLGATNSRGARIKATSGSGLTLTISWDYALDVERNHVAAALALAKKLNWHGTWVGGGMKEGYAFVTYIEGDQYEVLR